MNRKVPVYSDPKRETVAGYVTNGAFKKAAALLGVSSVAMENGAKGFGYVAARGSVKVAK